jgi:starch-binding outer membrane protein, SusD/RagB family
MKKRIILFILLICTSCEKLLDKDPVDKLSNEDTFKDMQGVKTALAGAYHSLWNYYGLQFSVYPELAGGNLKYSKSTSVLMEDVYSFTQTAENSSMSNTYMTIYSILNNINNVLSYAPNATGFTTATLNRVEAEARCLRALLHFDAMRLFARPYNFTDDHSHLGIVINLKPLLYTDPQPQRASIRATYDAIENDLLTAIPLFENTTNALSGGYSQHYFSANVAKALLARVYLYKQDWAKAKQYATEVIDTKIYSLISRAEYVASWRSVAPTKESIFEIAWESGSTGSSLGTYYATGSTSQMFAATNDLISLYSATDIRGATGLLPLTASYRFTVKYPTYGTTTTGVKILRLSEMYLIRAEADLWLNNFSAASGDLNMISQRADPDTAPVEYTDQTSLYAALLLERRKELAFEGHLLFDIQRNKQSVPRVDCNQQICTLPWSDYRMVLPIPMASTLVNNKMVQNENY